MARAFHYQPVHASWLNRVEIWFGLLSRHAYAASGSPKSAIDALLPTTTSRRRYSMIEDDDKSRQVFSHNSFMRLTTRIRDCFWRTLELKVRARRLNRDGVGVAILKAGR